MKLENTVAVDAPPDQVFALVNDVERVAGCVPGAHLDGRDGDTYHGTVTVKVGPVTASYSGTVRFLDVDATNRSLHAQARGVDTHGSGDAEAEVRLAITDNGEGSLLTIDADLLIRGKIAQFGKGAIALVSERLLTQFATNLAELLSHDTAPGTPPATGTVTSTDTAGGEDATGAVPAPAAPPSAATTTTDQLDGLSLVLGPAARYLPHVAAFGVGVLQGWLLGRLSAQKKQLRYFREVHRG
ncbi:SRPBCC family protein [Lipingzhangella sp. LS1_29]|uniref:SRPBCC family protein n=1 Tax=Lipingzhangella rawalii TaxID=2055835 RepID=A0ABU2H2V9_9ACTN|nr:SRPBCC family protein [Lipingzhangella rawalii]MDS1269633.1 SRPBCC family protein [Lipingzhangella rawalii]